MLLRADPGYIQWLEHQSFLHAAQELINVVSGTALAWQHDGTAVHHWPLLEKSSTWLELNPKQITNTDNTSSICTSLIQPSVIASIQQKGLALYLSDIQDTNSVWSINNTNTYQNNTAKNLPIAYTIAPYVGTEQELTMLANSLRQGYADAQKMLRPQLLGTDIIPASTALGPDFFLAARGHKGYIGTYIMIEIPQHDWALLPHVQEDWQCEALTPVQLNLLKQKGLIPKKLYRDNTRLEKLSTSTTQPSETQNSWAVTGSIRGLDGNTRRWIYAYADDSMHPILHWNDPSKQAQRIFSGSIIKNTGLLGMPLVGLSLQDLCGLEVQTNTVVDAITNTENNPKSITLVQENEPMLTAAQALAHEIRSYGGWSWLRQALPTALLPYFMQSTYRNSTGPDFCTSHVGDAMKQALEQGQAKPLHDCFDELVQYKIDSTRLAHILPSMSQHVQDSTLATTFLATQSGLVFYPTQSILPLATKNMGYQSKIAAQSTATIQDLQKSILALPNYNTWREQYHLATAKLIARLPSSKASLILLSSLPNKNLNTKLDEISSNEKRQYLITITNVTDYNMRERLSLGEHFSQKTPHIQEVNAQNIPLSSNNILGLQGDTHFIELEIPPKTCRIFIISSSSIYE